MFEGLLRRFTPRNDEHVRLIRNGLKGCFVAGLLAMTRNVSKLRNGLKGCFVAGLLAMTDTYSSFVALLLAMTDSKQKDVIARTTKEDEAISGVIKKHPFFFAPAELFDNFGVIQIK